MFNKLAIKLANYLLKRNLTIEQRNSLIINIMDKLQALPIADAISANEEGEIMIKDRPLDFEKARQLRESSRAVLDNQALRICREQVIFAAVALGTHIVETERQMLFARAAIWYHQQLDKHLKILSGNKTIVNDESVV